MMQLGDVIILRQPDVADGYDLVELLRAGEYVQVADPEHEGRCPS